MDIGAAFVPVLGRDNAFVRPEKWHREATAKQDLYYESLDERMVYTADNLIECYAASINTYLSGHDYSSIVLMGASEGSLILPFVYERMAKKDRVKCMVSIAGGALSLYDSYSILRSSSITPGKWREIYSYIIDNYDRHVDAWSNSIGVDKYGTPLLWLTSFLEINPFDQYKNIDIPVLFVHGEKDYNVAVESSKYVQENLPEKPFEYIFYKNMRHGPSNVFQQYRLITDIMEWISRTI
jgi:alpha-beta hydrolase superfamily lysophospholipase